MQAIVNNDSLRNFLSFVVVFTAMLAFSVVLAKTLNITIDKEKPCLLAPIFEKILKGLHVLDVFLNARNVGGLKNQFLGLLVGFFKGGIFVFDYCTCVTKLELGNPKPCLGRDYQYTEDLSGLGS